MKSNHLVIIGVDPGLMTGVFVWHSGMPVPGWGLDREKVYPQFEGMHVPAVEMPKCLRSMFAAWSDWAGHSGVHVAVEKYIITARTAKLTQQSDALEVTGMVKAVADQYLSTEVKQYLKANLKFASDDMLTAMGWRLPKMRHANDAARQASALLKEVDYPRWCDLVKGGTLDTTTNEEMTG